MRSIFILSILLGGSDIGEAAFLHQSPTGKDTSPEENAAAPLEGREKDAVAGKRFDNSAYSDDWHDEWKTGHYPSWDETYDKDDVPFLEKHYSDSQSDGKPSEATSLATITRSSGSSTDDPAVAGAGKPSGNGFKYEDSYDNEWHREWENGDHPTWKVPHESNVLHKLSPDDPLVAGAGEVSDNKFKYEGSYDGEWHNEWKIGDHPSWKETYPKDAIPEMEKYEDSQSDGKPSEATSLATITRSSGSSADDPAVAGVGKPSGNGFKYEDSYDNEWHKEWTNGDHPTWKVPQESNVLHKLSPDDPLFAGAGEASDNKFKYEDSYDGEWHNEWKTGDHPSWKETYPKDAIPEMEKYEDSQSDGNPS